MVFLALSFGLTETTFRHMFIPKNFKFKKQQKGKSIKKIFSSALVPSTGCIKLKALAFGRLSSDQLKALKQAVNKIIKKRGRIIFKIFPQTPITKKPIEVRMGKGKGGVSHWVAKVQPGTVICFVESEFLMLASKALNYGRIRLPLKTKIFA